ncbi:uncharacterized protein LOC116337554 isoform X2 [Contarinia nasturtii]|uniref:uncharacterized protein LOC116337554 isoform X2 n=1 Tax=Contarinia nasturtii TaxID=265458 RepID=UPI0012D3987F|nr:uncharacterized protein LOC116337554 isoform X2 [Contarinia nasturtii]
MDTINHHHNTIQKKKRKNSKNFFYYGGIFIMQGDYLYKEWDFIAGNVDTPKGESFLERKQISYSSVIFSILLFFCSACGVIACILVFYGLTMDKRAFLVPWIMAMVIHILLDIAHFIYLLVIDSLEFEPITAVMYVINFFLLSLNIYCLLCIISQYQVFKGSRRAKYNVETELKTLPQTIKLNYQNQPHNNNDKLISKSQALAKSIFYTKSTNKKSSPVSNTSPIGRRHSSNMLKKHVQFPEDFKCFEEEDEVLCINDSNGNPDPDDSPPSIATLQYQ